MYTIPGRIRYSEVDENGHITLPAIVDYFQDCSTFQSEDIGLSYRMLGSRGKAWLLSSWQIVVERYLEFAEEITTGTFSSGFQSFYGTRNFVLYDSQNRPAAYANSIWIFMDMEMGRPVRPKKEDIEGYGVEEAFPMQYEPRKILHPEGMTDRRPFPVAQSHIDTNHHVNNSCYIQMALEVCNLAAVRQVRAEYKHAAVYGDMIYPRIAVRQERTVVELCNEKGQVYAAVEFIGEK